MQRKKDTAALPAAVPSSPASSQPSFLTNKQVEDTMKGYTIPVGTIQPERL
jgi:hypothetical protein